MKVYRPKKKYDVVINEDKVEKYFDVIFAEIPEGEYLRIAIAEDGIGDVLVWPCEALQ